MIFATYARMEQKKKNNKNYWRYALIDLDRVPFQLNWTTINANKKL